MPEEIGSGDSSAADATTDTATGAPAPAGAFESPPGAPMPERAAFDPRARLHEIALALAKTRDRRLLVEYLQLRRAAR
jgi:hypothetical protein